MSSLLNTQGHLRNCALIQYASSYAINLLIAYDENTLLQFPPRFSISQQKVSTQKMAPTAETPFADVTENRAADDTTTYVDAAVHVRPWGQVIRSFVLLLGNAFYFLVPVAIAEAFRPDLYGHETMLTVAGCLISAMSMLLLFLSFRGMRRTPVYRMVSFAAIAVFLLGGVLLVIFRGKQATYMIDTVAGNDDGDKEVKDLKVYYRLAYSGRIVGETVLLLSMLLVCLSDLGILNDYEAK